MTTAEQIEREGYGEPMMTRTANGHTVHCWGKSPEAKTMCGTCGLTATMQTGMVYQQQPCHGLSGLVEPQDYI